MMKIISRRSATRRIHFHIVRGINYYYYASQLSFNFLSFSLSLFFSFIKIRKIEKEKYVVREITRQITFSRSYNCGDFIFF